MKEKKKAVQFDGFSCGCCGKQMEATKDPTTHIIRVGPCSCWAEWEEEVEEKKTRFDEVIEKSCPRTAECENFKPEDRPKPLFKEGDKAMTHYAPKVVTLGAPFWDKQSEQWRYGTPSDYYMECLLTPVPTYSGVAVHTPTKEEWDRVQRHEVEVRGKKWESWKDYIEYKQNRNCILVDGAAYDGKTGLQYSRRKYWEEEENKEIITVAEYFRRYGPERPKPEFKVGDRVKLGSEIGEVHEVNWNKNRWSVHVLKNSGIFVYGWEGNFELAPTPDPKMVKALRESIDSQISKFEEVTGEKYTPKRD